MSAAAPFPTRRVRVFLLGYALLWAIALDLYVIACHLIIACHHTIAWHLAIVITCHHAEPQSHELN